MNEYSRYPRYLDSEFIYVFMYLFMHFLIHLLCEYAMLQFIFGGQKTTYGSQLSLLPCRFWGLNSDPHAWWQTPLNMSHLISPNLEI